MGWHGPQGDCGCDCGVCKGSTVVDRPLCLDTEWGVGNKNFPEVEIEIDNFSPAGCSGCDSEFQGLFVAHLDGLQGSVGRTDWVYSADVLAGCCVDRDIVYTISTWFFSRTTGIDTCCCIWTANLRIDEYVAGAPRGIQTNNKWFRNIRFAKHICKTLDSGAVIEMTSSDFIGSSIGSGDGTPVTCGGCGYTTEVPETIRIAIP